MEQTALSITDEKTEAVQEKHSEENKAYVNMQGVHADIQEQFDYTKWQQDLFEDMTLEELNQAAVHYNKDHPFTGKQL
jgi:hypothetical protein